MIQSCGLDHLKVVLDHYHGDVALDPGSEAVEGGEARCERVVARISSTASVRLLIAGPCRPLRELARVPHDFEAIEQVGVAPKRGLDQLRAADRGAACSQRQRRDYTDLLNCLEIMRDARQFPQRPDMPGD